LLPEYLLPTLFLYLFLCVRFILDLLDTQHAEILPVIFLQLIAGKGGPGFFIPTTPTATRANAKNNARKRHINKG